VGIIEINLIFSTVDRESDCLIGFGAVEIIFKRGYYFFAMPDRLSSIAGNKPGTDIPKFEKQLQLIEIIGSAKE
jgi:hypothetical protein